MKQIIMSLRTLIFLATAVSAHLTPTPTPTPTHAHNRRQASITAISECHIESSTQYCHAGATEIAVIAKVTDTALPESYTDCHAHATATYCVAGDSEVQVSVVGAKVTAAASASETATATAVPAVSDCHLHGTELYCMAGTTEYVVGVTVTQTTDIPASYTGCHSHDANLYCMDANGDDVSLTLKGQEETSSTETESSASSEEMDCHFHAGVEHCVAKGGSESSTSSTSCARVDRDYDVKLRIGLLFVILATSALGVFAPILLQKYLPNKLGGFFVVLKQFGTGVIISTALVHLLTHSTLMFENSCLGRLKYEATSTAIMMSGIFLSFLVEYLGHRYVLHCESTTSLSLSPAARTTANEMVNITVMEAGIVFHSLLIGLTLVVTGDSAFMTLFIVIIFHQMFEGIALGSRIAALGTGKAAVLSGLGHHHGGSHRNGPAVVKQSVMTAVGSQPTDTASATASMASTTAACASSPGTTSVPVPMRKKLLLAAIFALVTPIGMAIGIGVLDQFNGNDKSTIVAIGTLDAFSAGILMWVGLVEMWAADWMYGELATSSLGKTGLGFFGLVSGMVAMSVLGKWA